MIIWQKPHFPLHGTAEGKGKEINVQYVQSYTQYYQNSKSCRDYYQQAEIPLSNNAKKPNFSFWVLRDYHNEI